jgi:hypothetical protein
MAVKSHLYWAGISSRGRGPEDAEARVAEASVAAVMSGRIVVRERMVPPETGLRVESSPGEVPQVSVPEVIFARASKKVWYR